MKISLKTNYLIYKDNEAIASSNNCLISYSHYDYHTNENIILLEFENIQLLHNRDAIKLKESDYLSLVLCSNGQPVDEILIFSVESSIFLLSSQITTLFVSSNTILDFGAFKIVQQWIKGQNTFYWQQYISEQIRLLWIKACMHWSYIKPREYPREFNVKIPCQQITSYYGFFCLLGEAFWGERGYIGRCFDSFDDCLIDIGTANTIVNIHIDNKALFEAKLKEMSPENYDYYSVWCSIMKNHRYITIHYN